MIDKHMTERFVLELARKDAEIDRLKKIISGRASELYDLLLEEEFVLPDRDGSIRELLTKFLSRGCLHDQE